MQRFDVAIVGGGVVGLATALAVLERRPGARVVVLEKEAAPALHQSGHNSGVIHAGLYYAPGSLKARNCVAGRKRLMEFCDRHAVAYRICGKLVVAKSPAELPGLENLLQRGTANGLRGLRRMNADELREREPYIRGVGAIWVPETGVVDFAAVAQAYVGEVVKRGGEVRLGTEVKRVREIAPGVTLETSGEPLDADVLVNCAGLQSDRVARSAGIRPRARIVPFRGEYYAFKTEWAHRVRGLVYPVPDPRFPFLGVHFTRTVHDEVECGPNAVLALHREGYEKGSFSLRDAASAFGYPGLWRIGFRHWRYGLGELHRSFSKRAFVHALQEYMPEIEGDQLEPGVAGIRAQAVMVDGTIVDDFLIQRERGMIHVLNAPSPAATASLAIGDALAGMILEENRAG